MLIADPLARNQPAILAGTRAFIGGQQAAPQRNFTTELQQALKGYQNTAGGFLDLNKTYQPLYTQLGLDNRATELGGYTDASGVYHPGSVGLDQATNTSNRLANTSDLGLIGPGVSNAILGSNPSLSNALYYQDKNLAGAAGGSPILSLLNNEATAGLKQGGELNPEQQRNADQSALSFFGNAGINNGNSAIAAQLFNRSAATTAAEDRARQFASGVQGLDYQQEGLVGSLAGNQANTATNSILGPMMQILGLGTLTPGAGAAAGASGAIAGANSLFDPTSGYLSDLFNTNLNSTAASNIAGANQSSALYSGLFSLLGSFLSDDRLKKGIKATGEETPEGIPIVSWIYKTDPKKRRWKGVLASEVEKVHPEAVLTDPLSGLRAVDYNAIGTRMSLHEHLLKEAA